MKRFRIFLYCLAIGLGLVASMGAVPAAAQTWDMRVKELTPAGGVCVTGLLAGILQTASCSNTINTGPGIGGGPIFSAGTVTLADFRAEGRIVASTGIPTGPIPTASVTNATNLFYIPSQNGGDLITIYNGTVAQAYHFGVAGQVIALGANWAANSAFDVFVVLVAGSPDICTVPWTSLTARATALDTTVFPFPTNSASITCRISNIATVTVPANQGTYVGSFYTNAGPGQIDFNFGSYAAGGGAASFGVWNAYNQVPVTALAQDSNASWTYSSATWRGADNSNGSSASIMIGLPGQSVSAKYSVDGSTNGGTGLGGAVGIFMNASASPLGIVGSLPSLATGNAVAGQATAEAALVPPIGQSVILAVESAQAATSVTFYAQTRQGLLVRLMM